jgi:vancomycin resistance protein YoaR
MNIVDAAYLTTPVVDFKFINDLNYPILIKTEITRPGDNWQYHTLKVYTSSEAPDRTVEFYDWKKWNEYSSKVFEAHFKRKVIQNGEEIRNDEFYSKYW